jgi:hypothetical protein
MAGSKARERRDFIQVCLLQIYKGGSTVAAFVEYVRPLSIKVKSGFMFYFSHDKGTLYGSDIGQPGQLIDDEVLVFLHVPHTDFKQVIV